MTTPAPTPQQVQAAHIAQLKSHFAEGRRNLIKMKGATDPMVRISYAQAARAEFEAVRFMWGWPASETGYGALP